MVSSHEKLSAQAVCRGRCLAWIGQAGPSEGGAANRVWHVPNVYRELVPIRRVDADREPKGCAAFVERRPPGFEDGNASIVRQPEEARLLAARGPAL